jgi:hypothetical protein
VSRATLAAGGRALGRLDLAGGAGGEERNDVVSSVVGDKGEKPSGCVSRHGAVQMQRWSPVYGRAGLVPAMIHASVDDKKST